MTFLLRSVFHSGIRAGVVQVSKTLPLCGGAPEIRPRLGRPLVGDKVPQQRILLAVADSKLKVAVGKLVQRADEWLAAIRTNQTPENLHTPHELGTRIPQQYRDRKTRVAQIGPRTPKK